MSKPIPTMVHGMLDYLTAGTLLLLPRLLGWSAAATTLLTVMAVATVLYSLVTRYELSIAKLLPMSGHLALDALSGLGLIAAAFLLPSAGNGQFIGLIALGLFELGASMLTETHSTAHAGTHRGVYDAADSADGRLERTVGVYDADGEGEKERAVGVYDNPSR